MLKRILLSVFLFNAVIAFSQNPYVFGGPDPNDLLPFPPEQMKQLKEAKVKTVTIRHNDDVHKEVYSFNKEGQALSAESFNSKGKRTYNWMNILYRYNTNGQLTIRHYWEDGWQWYDSLTYDKEGRLTSYFGYNDEYLKKKKDHYRTTYYNMKLESMNSNYAVLKDSTAEDSSITRYLLDRNNKCIKIIYDDCIDSLASITNKDSTVEKILYKCKEDTAFYLGVETTFKNGKKIREEQFSYSEPRNHLRTVRYFYNDHGQLIHRSNDNMWTGNYFYIYMWEGSLLFKEIHEGSDYTTVCTYSYTFWKD